MSVGTGNNQDELNRMNPAANHAKLGDLLVELIAKVSSVVTSLNYTMVTKAGLVIKAGSSALAKAGSSFVAIVAGVPVMKAANTDMAALVGTLATANSALWPFYINASGTLTTGAKTADAATAAAALALLPATPAGLTLIGFIIVTNASGAPFVGGTTALDVASVTTVYYDNVASVPAAVITTIGDINSR